MPAKAADANRGKSKNGAEVKKLLEGIKAILEKQLRFEAVADAATAAPTTPTAAAKEPAADVKSAAPAPATAAVAAAAAATPTPTPAATATPATAAAPAAEAGSSGSSGNKKKREKEKKKKAEAAAAAAVASAAAAATAKAEKKSAAPATAAAAAADSAKPKPRLRRDTADECWADINELQKELNRLTALQAEMDGDEFDEPITDSEKKENFARFTAWLTKEAPECKIGDKFEFVTDVPEGSGVRALKDLSDGEHFMSIPRHVCMSVETLNDSKRASYPKLAELLNAPESITRSMPSLGLAVHLLMERLNPGSFWRSYIDCLPRRFSLPLFFTGDELSVLRGSPLFIEACRLIKSTIRQYVIIYLSVVKAGHLKLPLFSYRQFRWAVAVVMTRQNRLPKLTASNPAGGSNSIALIPGWDFCNYSDGKMATYYNPSSDASESFTMRAVPKSAQIYIYYGSRVNSKLFMYSGFVYDEHSADYIEASIDFNRTLSPPASDPLHKLRHLMLANLGAKPNGGDSPSAYTFAIPCALEHMPNIGKRASSSDATTDAAIDRLNSAFPPGACGLLPVLRVAFLDKEEAMRVLKVTSGAGARTIAADGEQNVLPLVSDRNELAALKFAQSWINEQRSAYPALSDADLDSWIKTGTPPAAANAWYRAPAAAATAAAASDSKDSKQPAAAAGANSASGNTILALRMVRVEKRLWERASQAVLKRIAAVEKR